LLEVALAVEQSAVRHRDEVAGLKPAAAAGLPDATETTSAPAGRCAAVMPNAPVSAGRSRMCRAQPARITTRPTSP
jgi:hypothetical protein